MWDECHIGKRADVDRRFFVEAETVHTAEDDEVRASPPSFGTAVEEGSFAVHTKEGLDDRTYFLATTGWGKKIREIHREAFFSENIIKHCTFFEDGVNVLHQRCLLSVPVHWCCVMQKEGFRSPTVETSPVPMCLAEEARRD